MFRLVDASEVLSERLRIVARTLLLTHVIKRALRRLGGDFEGMGVH